MFFHKKSEKSRVDICKNIFDDYQIDTNEEKILIDELYEYIREVYMERLHKGNLNIEKEKIRINRSLGKYKAENKEKEDKLRAMVVSIYLTVIINIFLWFVKDIFKFGFAVTFSIVLLIIFLYFMDIEIKKDKNEERDLVNKLSLIVLKDIEDLR